MRKGGIREKAFAVEDSRFLLLPGYEHQRPGLIKPEYRQLMDEIPDLTDDGPLRFTSYAEVEGAYEISEPESLEARAVRVQGALVKSTTVDIFEQHVRQPPARGRTLLGICRQRRQLWFP